MPYQPYMEIRAVGPKFWEASKYIPFLQENNGKNFKDFEDLREQNAHLENQIRALK